jgi:hypothetical protein
VLYIPITFREEYMTKQNVPPFTLNDEYKNKIFLGNGLFIEIKDSYPRRACLFRQNLLIKQVILSDKIAKRLFIVDAVEIGAMKSRLALALGISRQTIDNYLGTKNHFGLEGLVQGYSPSVSKSRRKQRELHGSASKGIPGNKARQLEEIRRKTRGKLEQQQQTFDFKFGYDANAEAVEKKDQPYSEEHDWLSTRYAGVFLYYIVLISKWKWLQLVMGYFGSAYKIFMIFVLMSARNIPSIEQLKNIRSREAGILLGIGKIPSKPLVWEWFYKAADKRIAINLKLDYFRYQVCRGVVGIWLWFIDGHLLPYTGKAKVHHSYNTQRRMPCPGQTNMVTCDDKGQIVDFEIQEGKGDLRAHIVALGEKWNRDVPESPVMVFDREGSGVAFFSNLVSKNIAFVTWEKNIDSKALESIDEAKFNLNFKLNSKDYSVFEDEKIFVCKPDNPDEKQHQFALRHIYIWNRSSKRKTCGLAWTGNKNMNTEECARAILSRWGASENTFKHTKEKHPLHYHPGFKLKESKKQSIKNPIFIEKEGLIKRTKKQLAKLYKKFSQAKDIFNKDGSHRENSVKARLGNEIQEEENVLENLQVEKKELPERVDVSSLEDYNSFKCIDNEGKNLFDFVTASVWNARKLMVEWLRNDYQQENELVDLFYSITKCHGWIKSTQKEVVVRLEPMQQKSRRLAQEQLCRKLSSLGATTPNGKWLRIEVGDAPL